MMEWVGSLARIDETGIAAFKHTERKQPPAEPHLLDELAWSQRLFVCILELLSARSSSYSSRQSVTATKKQQFWIRLNGRVVKAQLVLS